MEREYYKWIKIVKYVLSFRKIMIYVIISKWFDQLIKLCCINVFLLNGDEIKYYC